MERAARGGGQEAGNDLNQAHGGNSPPVFTPISPGWVLLFLCGAEFFFARMGENMSGLFEPPKIRFF